MAKKYIASWMTNTKVADTPFMHDTKDGNPTVVINEDGGLLIADTVNDLSLLMQSLNAQGYNTGLLNAFIIANTP